MKRFKRFTEEEIRENNELQAQYFSKLTRFFDPPLPEGVPERLEQIVAAAEIKHSDIVLDIGTGTGISTWSRCCHARGAASWAWAKIAVMRIARTATDLRFMAESYHVN